MLPGSQAFSLSGGLTAEKGAKCRPGRGGVPRGFLCVRQHKPLATPKFGRCRDIPLEVINNEEIRDREVRLIDENGEQLGVMPTAKAMELAEERGLDLAKIQPTAKPPVCKLLDYDKYRYEQSRRERENRKNQRVVETKEVQLSATIEENDVLTKAKMAQKFLQGGDKVKVSIRFRGRQFTHSDIGLMVMQDFAARCAEVSSVERRPMMDGRHMIMILAPKAAKASFAEKKAARENTKGNQEQE